MKFHPPRKRFGQHFLQDRAVIAQIISAIRPQATDQVVEIGPGRGALTTPLLARVARLDVIEFDRDLVVWLQQQFNQSSLVIHQADVLQFDFFQCYQTGHAVKVVGNLPYNIATQLLFHLLDFLPMIKEMVFMLQQEVVERLVAVPNTSEYGKLSVLLQYFYEMETVITIPPSAFFPPPKVNSAVIRLKPQTTPPVEVNDVAIFSQIVKQAFAQRRKTLKNNLKNICNVNELEQLEINPQVRAENLTLLQFARLANYLEKRI